MADETSFPDHLRSEYDRHVMDAKQRARKARLLRRAFQDAHLWKPPASILDVGCGSGLLLASIDAPNTWRVGCDMRASLFQSSGLKPGEITFAQADAGALPFKPRQFDLVVCLAAIEEFPDWQKAMQSMAECVAPGGILYVTITNGSSLLQFYALLEKLGRRVSEGAWRYAKSGVRFHGYPPGEGIGVNALCGWRYQDVTPYLARAQFPFLRLSPFQLLNALVRYATTSFGYAWQRPTDLT